MNTIKHIIFWAFFMSILSLNAQEIQNYNFVNISPVAINPAASGINGNITGQINYRDQWAGLKGAPETTRFLIHGLITNAMGLGLKVEQTTSGIFQQFSTSLSYSYRIAMQSNQTLAFGVSVGFSQNKLNQDEMTITDNSDIALFNSNVIDEALMQTGFGMHYNWKGLNIHAASPLAYSMQDRTFLQLAYGLVDYNFYTPDKIWRLQPSVLFRYSNLNLHQYEAALLAEWNEKIWLNAGYRSNKNIVTGIGIYLKNIGIAYSYEIDRSDFSTVASGTHEILIVLESPYSLTKKSPVYRAGKRRNAWN